MKIRNIQQFIFLFLTACSLHAAQNVDFYATESSSQDTGMIQMTTDHFYSQFQTIDGYVVIDHRKDHYSPDKAGSNIAFYAEIQEAPEGGWICTLNALKGDSKKAVTSTKKYDSYYMILLDAKPSLENLLSNLAGKAVQETPQVQKETAPVQKAHTDIENLSGTWAGEDFIDKILILRSGKGVIIYKNGAIMNVSVEIEDKNVHIKQTGRSNASYFPELPRATALKNAASAPPVEWKLTLTPDGKLQGEKNTLVEDEDSPGGVAEGIVKVIWQRRK
ncbi:hypothetical protein [Treponema sp.]|uniref:TP0183 family DNA metabolism protein n=1 Tax=Treponema sp. TaxID=166 RepID=UPI0025E0AD78|nr:hypothetical protein [Treponema sp.]MCR5218102.1 hypothetical protein [Treponema sp.]